MLEIGALFMRTETELILKSRRVVPTRLLESGFEFSFPDWRDAAIDLCREWRSRAAGSLAAGQLSSGACTPRVRVSIGVSGSSSVRSAAAPSSRNRRAVTSTRPSSEPIARL